MIGTKSAQLFGLIALLLLNGGCGASSSIPLEKGSGGAFTSKPDAVSFYWDELGSTTNPLGQQSVSIASGQAFQVLGWALSGDHASKVSEVDLMIDGEYYKVPYGSARADVAQAFKTSVADCGFQASFPASKIRTGEHKVALRIIAQDRVSYLQSPDVTLRIQ